MSLHLENLVTKGNIPRYGQAATQAAATYPRPLGLDLWPAILPDVNSEIVLTNVLSYSYAISNCTETALRSLVLNYDFVFGPGTQAGYRPETNSTYLLGEHDMPIIIRGTDGTTIGTMTLVANGVSWGCLEDPNEPPSAALSPDVTMDPNGFLNGSVAAAGTPPAATSSSEGGGLSTGAVVGISVAAAVGVAVALVVGFMTFRTLQRRKRMGAIYMVPSSSTPSTPKKDSPSIGIMLPMGPVDTLNKNHQEMAVASALRVRFGSLEGLELGQLIGRGAHGRIYKGSMRGAPVAVKVVEHSVESGRGLAPQGVTTEALLLTALAHPNILRVHRVASIKLQGGLAAGSRSSLESGDGLGSRGRGESSTPLPSPTTLASGDGSSPPQPSSPRDPSGEAPHGKMDGNQGASPRVSTSSPSKGVVSGKTVSSFLTNSDTGAMYSARSDPPSSILGISGAGLYETWLILEYCEKGSLHDAIQKKRAFLFKDGRPAPVSACFLPCACSPVAAVGSLDSLHMLAFLPLSCCSVLC